MTTQETTDKATTGAELGAHVATEKASAKKNPSHKTRPPRGRKIAKRGNAKSAMLQKQATASKKIAKSERTAVASRPGSKGARILELMRRPKGVTLAEIMKITGWQPHSVRGFISIAGKKHNMKIESSKSGDGNRVYGIAE
jgi:hypothetical protein